MSHIITKKLARLIRQAPNLLTVLIWSVGVVGLTAWAITDFIPLLDEYRNNNVDTQVAVIRDDAAWPPNLTICIPYYSDSLTNISNWLLKGEPSNSCMECEALEQRGWDVWTDFNNSTMIGIGGNVEAMKTALTISFMRRILNESARTNNLDCLTLNRSNFNWNQPLLDAVWKFLIGLKFADYTFFYLGKVSMDGIDSLVEEIMRRQLLDELLVRLYASIEIYYQRVVAYTAVDLERKIFSVVPLRDPALSIVGGICFQASNSPYFETFRYVAFSGDEIDPPWIRSPRSMPFSIWIDDKVTAYGTAPVMHVMYESDTRYNHENVQLDFSVDVKVVETRPDSACIRNETLPSCTIRLFVQAVVEKCSCLPFGYKSVFPNMGRKPPYCSASAYSKCAARLTDQHDTWWKFIASFLDTCSKQCEFISRKPIHRGSAMQEASRDLVFDVLFIHLEDSPHVEFSIVAKTSWQKFVSDIGGTVGLYLGFSGLSIVALIVFCVEHVAKRCLDGPRKKVHVCEQNGNHADQQESIKPVVYKRILVTDIAKMIQEQQRIAREETMEMMKAMEVATEKKLQKMIRVLNETQKVFQSVEERFVQIESKLKMNALDSSRAVQLDHVTFEKKNRIVW